MKVLMIVQEPVVTRRILQEAHSLIDAGYDVNLLTRAEGTEDYSGEIEGIPAQWVAVRGRDRRFRLLYGLAGVERGSQAAALWSVLTGRHTFSMRALPFAIRAQADVYHAHDLNNLELAYQAARQHNARLVYDSHELFPDVANRWVRLRRKAWMRTERRLMRHCDLTITVNEFIADILAERNGVPPPLVVLNCPDPPLSFDISHKYNLIRDSLGLPAGRKVVLYHGYLWEGRGLENLVRSAKLLREDTYVVITGYGPYEEVLRRMVADERVGKRVYILPAVPYRDLVPYCASADVGIVPIQNVGLNYYYSSPNRLFDFIQAGVPIVANDLPYLRKIVAGEGLGIVSTLETPEQYAQAINKVLSQPDGGEQFRANLRRVAPQFTWEIQARKLVAAYEGLGVRG